MTDRTKRLLGKYEILEELGRGGFGAVYRACDTALNRTVALKVLAPQWLADPGFVGQFRREAQLAARLDHPNIVTVYDVGEAEGIHFIAMQYVAGGSLDRRLERGRPWLLERVLPLAEQVAAALDYAHGQGVLHLDLKPGNILVDDDGRAWLADFGLGRAVGSASMPASALSGGTPAYLAPEQADLETRREITSAADLYAFGVVLYQLCTGRVPFEGNPMAVAAAHVNQGPPRPTLLNGELPQAVEDVLLRALAKAPQARYPDGAGLAAALAEAARAGQARPALRRVLAVEPLSLGDFKVHTLRELAGACDATWEEAVQKLYDGTLEAWLTKARALAAAEEAKRIREARAKAQGREREKGLEEFLRWTGYVTEPVLAVQPEVLDFGAEEKGYGYRLLAVLTVQNAGRGLLWGEAKARVPWLSVPEGGSFAVRPGERHEVLAEADLDALPSGRTEIEEAVAVHSPVGEGQVAARIEVLGPVVQIEPAGLDFGEVREGEVPVRSVTIANRGRGALEGTVRADVRWLAVTPEHFRCTAGRQQALQVRVVSAKLTPVIRFGEETRPLGTGAGQGSVVLQTNEGEICIPVRVVNLTVVPLEMVKIPAGEFRYGDKKERVNLPEFWIAKTPVTNAQYKAFVDATGHPAPGHWEGGRISRGKENHPVVYVSWHDAVAFCEWAGLRLPTEQEWEKGARGTDGREYPWGNQEPDATRCNFNKNVGDTTPVGQYPAGASPYGCLDMAGNVWEWCEDWYERDKNRVLRGGSWDVNERNVRSALRNWSEPDGSDGGVGFRCARSRDPGILDAGTLGCWNGGESREGAWPPLWTRQ